MRTGGITWEWVRKGLDTALLIIVPAPAEVRMLFMRRSLSTAWSISDMSIRRTPRLLTGLKGSAFRTPMARQILEVAINTALMEALAGIT